MIRIGFKPSFVRQLKNLEQSLKDEVLEKIELFKDRSNHTQLKVHKLHGSLADAWSFSVNYKIRIVFAYEGKNEAVLLAIGDHDIYK
ncbi:MAG: Plasmid stabilization system [Candidatus Beckwithbacteria bacterium GW2011_GWC2_47_9]|uniref:Plasmid stabilization system n=2 Tax=Patescibacteria group TaxID=1783273 RepID=A0A0G1M8A7_9BACT|nr:MAG: Plasmid stabilization system [Parcubacteria group bacterium GW2011_GWB1_44_7]KKU04516.1 MAG: Plasmid stabilization system [Candidatus Giovannonibacteria bacterium GW2011_GWA2_45_21]KKU86930.1 MAG: Plasmid stabilization system [Candidatus Beckwithbacteria bacterium GW2011_GWC2_47_9]